MSLLCHVYRIYNTHLFTILLRVPEKNASKSANLKRFASKFTGNAATQRSFVVLFIWFTGWKVGSVKQIYGLSKHVVLHVSYCSITANVRFWKTPENINANTVESLRIQTP